MRARKKREKEEENVKKGSRGEQDYLKHDMVRKEEKKIGK